MTCHTKREKRRRPLSANGRLAWLPGADVPVAVSMWHDLAGEEQTRRGASARLRAEASTLMMVIETERLVLCPIGLADIDEFLALHADPEVTRFVRSLDRFQAQERLEFAEREWIERGHGMFAVRDQATGRFLGRAGLKHWPQFDETEIGWMLHRDAWGHGYATEAARACIDWGFAQLPVPYLTAMIQPENVRSIRVAERLGLTPLRTDVLLGDEVVVYAARREEWQ